MFLKLTPKTIGFLQALGLGAYIALIALAINFLSQYAPEQDNKILAPITFLLAFVISALISSALILGYPVILFFDGKKSEAIKIVVWSAIWLVILLGIMVFGLFWLA